MQIIDSKLITQAVEWLSALIKIETSNPPGGERAAVEYIENVLQAMGIASTRVAADPDRPNLVVKLSGAGATGGLALSSHLDVVPVEDASRWKFPPFSATLHDGMIWGRGALDMKYKTALDLALLAWARNQKLAVSLEVAFLADEETGGELGVKYLLTQHRAALQAQYVINEVGGFPVMILGKPVIVLQAGEKGVVHFRLHTQGSAGHASTPEANTAIELLSWAIAALSEDFVGHSICATTERFVKALASAAGGAFGAALPGLLGSGSFSHVLAAIPDPTLRAQIRGMVCHTLVATRIGGGFKSNVVPEAAWADFDCRIIPGTTVAQVQQEIESILKRRFGDAAKAMRLEVLDQEQGYELDATDPFFDQIAKNIEACWKSKLPTLVVVPMLMPASSDSSSYARAGIKPIGFAPALFEPDFPGIGLSHGINERIPVEAFKAGVEAYIQCLAPRLLGT